MIANGTKLASVEALTGTSMNKDQIIFQIARQHLRLETLETLEARNRDALEFKEQAVWNIKAALEAAYEAGRASAQPRRPRPQTAA